ARLVSSDPAGGPQAALSRFRAEAASRTAALADLDRALPAPAFVGDPPLTLDDVDFVEGRLPSGPPLLRTHFGSTPFTDLSLIFDARGVRPEDVELLPLLPAALTEVGVTTAKGERLDYVQAQERLRAEIYGFSADFDGNPETGRFELAFQASTADPAELGKAAGWLESYLFRPALGPASRGRLVDVLRTRQKWYRSLFQEREESWVDGAAEAYLYQDDPLHMATRSPFTALRHLTRLRWRLEDPSPEAFVAYAATFTALTAALDGERAGVARLLEGVPGELGETLRFELAHLPPDGWREDLRRVAAETREDLSRKSGETIGRLSALARSLLVRRGLRVHVNGNPANTASAAAALERFAARLPQGTAVPPPPRRAVVAERLSARYPGLGRAVHAALVNND
ncbi:MAG: hypothetical protein FD126_3346, partial [Elusimicrobia bacterium]